MKNVYFSVACCVMLCLSQQSIAQTNGIPFTGSYQITVEKTHVMEKDTEGNVTQAMNIAVGTGTNSILGNVTTLSFVHTDLSAGDNVIEFTETDADGNSLFVKTKGVPGKDGGWMCYGAILGGTGKYKTATGHYVVTGTTEGLTSTCSAEGTLYFTSEEENTAAIKQVIENETKSYYANDNKGWTDLQSSSASNGGIYVLEPGAARMERGEEFRKALLEYPRPGIVPKVKRSNWDIQVRGDVAWASFEQQTIEQEAVTHSLESRILEKIDGTWKIAFTTVALYNK